MNSGAQDAAQTGFTKRHVAVFVLGVLLANKTRVCSLAFVPFSRRIFLNLCAFGLVPGCCMPLLLSNGVDGVFDGASTDGGDGESLASGGGGGGGGGSSRRGGSSEPEEPDASAKRLLARVRWRAPRFDAPPRSLLHSQLIALASSASPTEASRAALEGALRRAAGSLARTMPGGSLDLFGSNATDLSLPSSDLDLVITTAEAAGAAAAAAAAAAEEEGQAEEEEEEEGEEEEAPAGHRKRRRGQPIPRPTSRLRQREAVKPLRRLMRALLRDGVALGYPRSPEVVRARVPILKYTDAASRAAVDVCIDQEGGPRGSAWVRGRLRARPQLRPLLLAVKLLLRRHGLSETYTGGVGSYLLFVMAERVARHNGEGHGQAGEAGEAGETGEADLGALLVLFLARYAAHRGDALQVPLPPPLPRRFPFREASPPRGFRAPPSSQHLRRTRATSPAWHLPATLPLPPPAPDAPPPSRSQMRDPLCASVDLGAKCFRWRAVSSLFGRALAGLRSRGCISALLPGWRPRSGDRISRAALAALGEPRPAGGGGVGEGGGGAAWRLREAGAEAEVVAARARVEAGCASDDEGGGGGGWGGGGRGGGGRGRGGGGGRGPGGAGFRRGRGAKRQRPSPADEGDPPRPQRSSGQPQQQEQRRRRHESKQRERKQRQQKRRREREARSEFRAGRRREE